MILIHIFFLSILIDSRTSIIDIDGRSTHLWKCLSFRYDYGGKSDFFGAEMDAVTEAPVLDASLVSKITKELELMRSRLSRMDSSDSQVKDLRVQVAKLEDMILPPSKLDQIREIASGDDNDKKTSVCPEHFKGTLAGYPLYKTGFVTEACEHARADRDLVTIVFNYVNLEQQVDEQTVIQIVNETMQTYPGVRIKIATHYKIPKEWTKANMVSILKSKEVVKDNVKVKRSLDKNDGVIWNALVEDVQTPYVYIAQDLAAFEASINFERMVRKIKRLRDLNNHCFATTAFSC